MSSNNTIPLIIFPDNVVVGHVRVSSPVVRDLMLDKTIPLEFSVSVRRVLGSPDELEAVNIMIHPVRKASYEQESI